MERRVLGLGVLLLLLALLGPGHATDHPPKVEVYSRTHAVEGVQNILQCFVTGFHPPRIHIELLKNDQPMADVQYGDLSFNEKWQFQRLVYAPFIPTRDDIFACRVTHSTMPEPQTFRW
ncbi:B2MG protein, partial [Sclerurus mexicanus]|nr:B2MG protein [Sclerurus mexicanus]